MFTILMGNMTSLNSIPATYVYKEGTLSSEQSKLVTYDVEERLGTLDTGVISLSESQIDIGEEGTADKEQLVGLQFELNIDSSVYEVQDAKIQFQARRSGTQTIEKIIIFVEDTGNPTSIQNSTNYQLSNRTWTIQTNNMSTSKYVTWPTLNSNSGIPSDVEWLNVTGWTENSYYDTPDISDLINYILQKSNWSSGNKITFGIIGYEGRHKAWSLESSGTAATLKYKLKTDPIQTLVPNSKIQDIPQSINVINFFEQNGFLGSGGAELTDSDVKLGHSDTGDYANYLINVTEAGDYMFQYLISGYNNSNGTGQLIMTLFDLSYQQVGSILETITFDSHVLGDGITGDWNVFSLRNGSTQFSLSTGKYILQLKVGSTDSLDIKGLEVVKLDSTTINSTPVNYKVKTVPGKIEAEDYYNNQGLNIVYYRDSAKLSNTATGEYTEYIINVTQSRFYSLKYSTTAWNGNTSGSGTLIPKLYNLNSTLLNILEYTGETEGIDITIPTTFDSYGQFVPRETTGTTKTYIESGTYVLRLEIGTNVLIHPDWIELVEDTNTVTFTISGDQTPVYTGSPLSVVISPDNDSVPWSMNGGTAQAGDQTYTQTNEGSYTINISTNNEFITASPTSFTFEIKPPPYRYFKFEIQGTSNISEIEIRYVNILTEDNTSISTTATAISTWTNISNLTNSGTSFAYRDAGSGSFKLDCGAGTEPHHYEIWSKAGDNPNRIPVRWTVSGSHNDSTWTTLHTVNMSAYKYSNRSNNNGWDWRTYNSSTTEWSGMTPHMEVDDDGTIITSSNPDYLTGKYKVLWCTTSSHGDYTNESDILCPQYSRFLRANFGNNDNTVDTFLLQ